jgi:hypothetical protein
MNPHVRARTLACIVAIALAPAAVIAGNDPAPDAAVHPGTAAAEPSAEPEIKHAAPADGFMGRIARHCGQAFEGRVITNEPPQPDDAFAGKRLVMHVRSCDPQQIMIPFHVGDDRSRTWVLTRLRDGLRLKHDHRHEDGSDDAVTMYGGDTSSTGSEARQEFPVDAESVAMFEREGLSASVTNTWAMEVETGKRFLYELSRPGGRLFQVEFDLTRPVDPPPAPWGHP